ncbi:hypothetical protein SEA_RETRO23_33 [Mycobacterium phage Retro23]|uniref:Uncharacterized protein n=1 Tax=Mycobacterium phage Anselm TaxID=2041517 RepID=A0A2D1G5S9_9CAUD|nr:hypothetical protein KIY79_gp33 [Mycobacterium phage Anselm]ATN87032.1 hypothetical protein SEA_ANSELM_33 [Mycobacterium phage Anselm]ATN88466.1 hypothetical protein SEA_DALMATIAN_33 [Mycobacterium phage Dalmatian]QGJ89171.1 hypothetical protein SEA_RETRO23_33 [Mycobacterium phage Retro23]
MGYGIEYTPKARRKVVDIRPKAGPVTVTKPDGTVEIVQPLPPKKTRQRRKNRR